MGLFRDLLKLANEIITLGGAVRLEDAKRAYEESRGIHQPLLARADGYKARIDDAVAAIGTALTHARPYLEVAERLIKSREGQRRDLDIAVTTQTLQKVERFNAGMSSAINVGIGSIAGGTMAVGAWSLVALFGSASTGTAISGLSGIAATNATLAWFGGGALAAGGTGIAGGMTVLGGIVAVPLVYFAAKSTHKKAKEVEDAKMNIEKAISDLRTQLETLPLIVELVEARQRETERLCTDVVARIVALNKAIQPQWLLSVAKQKILALLGKEPYSRAQSDAIRELTLAMATFIAAFDAQASDLAPRTQKP